MLGNEARENGLKYSLLERLRTLYEKCGDLALEHMVTLNTNYRCDSEVVKIPNELFYESKIKTCAHAPYSEPMKFVCSSLSAEVDHKLEAQVLLEQVKEFAMSKWPLGWSPEEQKSVCLATASRTQVCKYLMSILQNWQ